MNKPIRTVSIFCLLLFLALALNATYLQYYHANALNDRVGNGRVATATFSRDRGAILVGRTSGSPRASRVQGPVQVPARLPPAVHVRPGHRLVHLRQRDRRRARRRTPSSPARTTGCSSTAWSTWSTATPPRAATSCSPSTRPRRRRRSTGCGRSAPTSRAPSWRSSPRTGKILAMVSLPTYDPNKLAAHDFKAANAYATQLVEDAVQTRCSTGRSRRRCRRARRSRWSPPRRPSQSGKYTATSLVPGGPSVHAAAVDQASCTTRSRRLRQRPRSRSRRRCSSPATPPSRRSPWRSAPTACTSRPRGSASTSSYLDRTSARPRRSRATPPASTRPRPRCPASARAR